MQPLTSDTPNPDDVAILVVSCDAYKDLWHPFFHCFFKYWPDCPYPVFLGSNYVTHADPRVTPILIGQDSDYSSGLIEMLRRIPHEWVIFWIEDRPPCAPVDTKRLGSLLASAQRLNAAYLKLLPHYPLAYEEIVDGIGITPQGSRYRVCVTIGFWNKSVFVQLLRGGETAWDIERQGSRRSDHLPHPFCCFGIKQRKHPPIVDKHLVMKGRLIRDAHPFLLREGVLADLESRQLQPYSSYVYLKSYIVFFHVVYHLLYGWHMIKKLFRIGHSD